MDHPRDEATGRIAIMILDELDESDGIMAVSELIGAVSARANCDPIVAINVMWRLTKSLDVAYGTDGVVRRVRTFVAA